MQKSVFLVDPSLLCPIVSQIKVSSPLTGLRHLWMFPKVLKLCVTCPRLIFYFVTFEKQVLTTFLSIFPQICQTFQKNPKSNTVGIWNPTIWNPDFLKVGFQMVRFSNGQALAIVPTIWKPNHSKPGHFRPDFKWFLTKWLPFVRISNGKASRFQIQFEIQTICNLLDHSKSRLGQTSDSQCKYKNPFL